MPTMMARSLLTFALLWTGSPVKAQDDAAIRRQGQALLARHCSRCHAIASTGDSPHPQAPPFRTLGQKYPVDFLAEALAEGLSTGHDDMPEFAFEPHEINAILAYLASIQVPRAGPAQGRPKR